MTNPETYFRDAERLEGEMFGWGRSDGRQTRASTLYRSPVKDRMYSKETLPSGCILYSLRAEKLITCPETETPDVQP